MTIEQTIPGKTGLPGRTGFAVFSKDDALLEANDAVPGIGSVSSRELFGKSMNEVFAELGNALESFDGKQVADGPVGLSSMLSRWQQFNAPPVEARTVGGDWLLLTSHPRPAGGVALISVDFTAAKKAQLKQVEEEEIFRCITDSHPLPVWVADEDTGEILYESIPASQMLGRLWDAETPQYITPHYASEKDREAIKTLLDEQEVLNDHEVQFQDVNQRKFWISANVRRGVYKNRSVLIAGVLDITKRKREEEERRQNDAVLRKVLEACPVPVQMTRAEDGSIMYRSPETLALFGQATTAQSYYANSEERRNYLKVLKSKGSVDDFHVNLCNANGDIFPASISARLIEFEGEEVIVSNTFDMTEKIASDQQVRRANERLIDAIESLSEGFALYDKNDQLIMCNSRYREMHKVSADALRPGVNWFDFLRTAAQRKQFPVEPDRIDDWLAERARDRHEYRAQEFQHTDGGWYFVTNSPTREGGFVVTRMDITERKQMEQAQLEAGELVQQVLDACPVAILMNGVEDGRIIYRSPAAAELYGETKSAKDHYADTSARDEYLALLERHGKVDGFECEAIAADGRHFPCIASARMIDYQGEQVIVSHTQDLTERRTIQAELERQKEALHQSEKMSALGELLAGVAHELNNPLSVVVGQSLLLKETATDDAVARRADKIGTAADRCARIVKTFLAMARQRPAKFSNVSITELVESALEITGYSLRSSGIDLSLNLDPEIPDVLGDADQLGQVFTNVLINAEQALKAKEGRRKIKIVSRYDSAKNEVVIKIADNGPGIPANIRSRIFEPFFTTKEVGTGTGIGLAFCHRIVETHGGVISARANPGGGTAFFVRLPATTKAPGKSVAAKKPTSKPPAISVLVVDDEPDVAELIMEILEADGANVTVALSGAEALRKISARGFDIVLSDLNMPELNGLEFFEALEDANPEMTGKLAFVTGDTMSPKARTNLERTGRPFLEKPIRPADLRELVAKLSAQSL